MLSSHPVSLALVGLFVWVTGCTSYHQIELAEVADYGEARGTLADGERSILPEDAIVADSFYLWGETSRVRTTRSGSGTRCTMKFIDRVRDR